MPSKLTVFVKLYLMPVNSCSWSNMTAVRRCWLTFRQTTWVSEWRSTITTWGCRHWRHWIWQCLRLASLPWLYQSTHPAAVSHWR